jgi:hypothetical protein
MDATMKKNALRCRTCDIDSEMRVTQVAVRVENPHYQQLKSKFGTRGAEVQPQGAEVQVFGVAP